MGRNHMITDRSASLWRDIRRKSKGSMSRANLKATMEARNKQLDVQTTTIPGDVQTSPEDKIPARI